MPRLSSYSNLDYPEGEQQIMPWEFWTDQQRSLVIKEGYNNLVLSSSQIKPYLNASRTHFYTQWLVPLIAAGLSFGPFRGSIFAKAYKMHPRIGFKNSALLTGGFTLFWLNLSPFYISKQEQQIRALKTMWNKIGINMKMYNDLLSNTTTSSSLDKQTWEIYSKRQSLSAGNSLPQEDMAPYILGSNPATNKIKKIYM